MLWMPSLAFSQSWLWEVSKKGIKNKSYLFGTFHDIGNWYLDSMTKVKKTISESEVVMVESIHGSTTYETSIETPSDEKPQAITPDILKNLSHGQKYWKNLLPDSSRKILEQFVDKYQMAGIYLSTPPEVFLAMQRYYTMDYCDNARRPSDTIFRMDHYIEILAKKNNIKLIGLDDLTPQAKNQAPKHGIIEKTNDTIWAQGCLWYIGLILRNNRNADCKSIDDYVKNIPSFYIKRKRIDYYFNVVERNNSWVKIILKHLSQSSCFIASGYQHLRFEDGLISLLRKKGYRVKPVKM
jgi:uncharacterized protein YbaP (TraB family)